MTQALNETVTGISFIPAVNLDEAMMLARFGKPDKIVQLAGVKHFLYPAKGLEIALHEESIEVLQYISPNAFKQLLHTVQ